MKRTCFQNNRNTNEQTTYKLSVRWSGGHRVENGTFKLMMNIPPNSTAKIIVPANVSDNLMLKGSQFANTNDVQLLKKGENTFELKAQPGRYLFESKIN
jgi:alpha-L-rhamnosidase